MKKVIKHIVYIVSIVAMVSIVSINTSCVKDPDESNLYTFKGKTIYDIICAHSDLSSFRYILERADMDQLMSSYGQYTCFVPTNDAIEEYIDSLYDDTENPLFVHNGMTERSLEGLNDSLCIDIAKFHLSNSYLSTIDMSSGITISTMLTRTITASVDSLGETVLNEKAKIIGKDSVTINGYLHILNKVIPRSNRMMADEMKQHEEYSLFYKALVATTLADSMLVYEKDPNSLGTTQTDDGWWVPTTCKVGFTIFAEPDVVFNKAGITDIETMAAYAKQVYQNCADPSSGWYDYARDNGFEISTGTDYENPWNVLNMFIRYHILKYAIPRNYLIIDRHYYHDVGAECYEYYETMLDKTLMKFWQVSNRLYLNRYQTYNTLTDVPLELGNIHVVEEKGLTLGSSSMDLQPLNGYIIPISGILQYDEKVPKKVLNERMRMDILSCMPEFMTNGIRWMKKAEATALNGGTSVSRARIPSLYSDNIRIYNTTTKLDYNFQDTGDWLLYQGDAFRGNGVYDLAVKLPPVPAGEYELRLCYPSVTDHGSMFQIYLGTSPKIADMQAIDIPMDLRLNFVDAPSIRYTFPLTEEDGGIASDKALKARGFMRGPITYGKTNASNPNARWGDGGAGYNLAMRRIIVKQYFDQKDYWLRVKSVLPDNTSGIFQIDYIEFAPTTVTDNTQYVEDIY